MPTSRWLSTKWQAETSGSFVCSPRVQKAPRKTFMCIILHKPTIYQKVNTVSSNILRAFSIMDDITCLYLKKYILFKCLLFTLCCILRFDNGWDETWTTVEIEEPQVTNDSQEYSPVLTAFLQKGAIGSKGERHGTNRHKWYWWKNIFWELIYKCLELPIAEILAN